MRTAANICTFLRILLAPLFVWQLAAADSTASGVPLAIYVAAALSDFVDGPLARTGGRVTWTGRLLDHGADAVFLFPGLVVLSRAGRVPPLLPCAALLAFGLYCVHGWQRGRACGGIDLVASRVGAAAGVANYAVTGAAAGALYVGRSPFDQAVYAAALFAGALNLLAAFERAWNLRRPLLRASHAPDP